MRTFLQGNPTVNAIVASVLTLAVLAATYFMFEPIAAYAVPDTFTVTQEITSEIAFKTLANDVTMTPAIQGITGGNAFGTSTVAINTNNPTGYNMTIAFATTTALQGENIGSDIDNYIPAGGAGDPDYNFAVGANDAEFGYTVRSVTTPLDVADMFQHNGSNNCDAGQTGTAAGHCWYNVANATDAVTIIDRPTATPGTGATSTIVFQVGVSANPSPAVQTGFYTATATLTALTNP
jgi:hypothetical protein